MSKLRVLDFQYNISKKLQTKPVKWLTVEDRQISDLIPKFQPNTQEMKQVFDKIDSNKDGKISSGELKSLLEAVGRECAASEVNSMMRAVDLNGDGFIDFGEFMEIHKKGIRTSELQSAFGIFDQNGDGRISADELRAMLRKLGESYSLEECQRMVRQVDKNGDGLVDMDEFMAMMTSTMQLA